ncbi:hypothetical protein WA026_016334 [Henosepilachna vigintioctopunctata]|uniref:Uncharacterized protein n=1 Tax=Henosepilachna vigintioctopunctata TaxID=420089 RepID=A0AAW1ULS0_9CUCU
MQFVGSHENDKPILLIIFDIGAIFTEDQKDTSVEFAFKYAVYKINREREFFPNTTLVYDIQYVPRDDSFRTSKRGMRCRSLVPELGFPPERIFSEIL